MGDRRFQPPDHYPAGSVLWVDAIDATGGTAIPDGAAAAVAVVLLDVEVHANAPHAQQQKLRLVITSDDARSLGRALLPLADDADASHAAWRAGSN